MARSIGSIEVVVEADTRRLKAQMARSGAEAGKAAASAIEEELDDITANVGVDVDSADLRATEAQIEEALDDLLAEVGVRVDETDLEQVDATIHETIDDLLAEVGIAVDEGDLERVDAMIHESIDDLLATVGVAVSEADIAEVRAELDQSLDDLLATIDVTVSEADIAAVRAEVTGSLDDLLVSVGVTLDNVEAERARAELEAVFVTELDAVIGVDLLATEALAESQALARAIEETFDDIRAHIAVSPDMVDVAETAAIINEGVSHIEAEVDVDYNRASKAKTDAAIERNFQQLGSKSGKGFADNLISGDNTKLFLLAGLTMGDALASGISGTVAAGTSVISSAITSIGAAAGAATPLVAGFAGSLATVVVGSRGFTDALKAITKEYDAAAKEGRAVDLATGDVGVALSKLAPSARFAAIAFAHLKDDLHNVRIDVQQKLFEGFAAEIADLGKNVLPDVSRALQVSATSLNRFAKQLADVARQTDFEDLAKGIKPAMDDAFDAASALADMLVPFLRAAAEPAERLAEMIERGAEGMRDWTKANPEAITEFLDDGLTSLTAWVELIKSTGDLLATIFDAGAESGDNFVIGLNNIIERWDGFLESTAGQQGLKDFFDSGSEAMHALEPILDGLKEAFDVLVTDETMGHFEDLAQAIGDALPALAELIALIGELELAAAFANLLEAMEPVFRLLQLIPDEMLQMAGTAIVVAAGLSKIVSGMQAIGLASKALTLSNPYILAIGAAITVAAIAFEAFSDGADDAAQRTEELTKALENNIDAAINSGDAMDSARIGIDNLNKTIFETSDGGKKIQEAFALINRGAGDAALGINDTVEVMSGLKKTGDESIPTLKGLAEGYGLPAEAAARLAEIVAGTDDNMDEASKTVSVLGIDLRGLADDAGLPRDEVIKLFGAMEELQDQAENTDLGAMQQGFIDSVSTGSAAEQAILANAQAMQEAGKIAQGVGPLFDELVRQLDQQRKSSDDAAEGELIYGDALSHIDQAVAEANAASAARSAELKKERDAAFDAWQEEQKLAAETKGAAAEAAAAKGFSADLATEIINLGDAAHDSADKAGALMDAIELLIAPAATVESGMSDLEAAIDDFGEAITGGQEAADLRAKSWEKEAESVKLFAEANELAAKGAGENTKTAARLNAEADVLAAKGKTDAANLKRAAAQEAMQADADGAEAKRKAAEEAHNAAVAAGEEAAALEAAAHSMDISTEAGRANREALRDQAATALELAGAMITTGAGADEVTAKLGETRAELVRQAEAYGLPTAEAQTYINTLLGTPELINTIIATPGMFEALLNTADLTLLYDAAGNPVITEFEAIGLDPALATSEEFKTLLDQLNQIHADPTVTVTTAAPTAEEIAGVQGAVETLDSSNANPTLALPEGATVEEQLANLQTAVNNLDVSVAKPEITLINQLLVSGQIERLQTNLNTLDATVASPTVLIFNIQSQIDKVVELQRNLNLLKDKTITVTVNQAGGVPEIPGGMAGELITHPTIRRVGERGLTEAIVPLQLPLNRVDPSVRHLAELLRGGAAGGPGIKRQVNNYLSITPASADPAAVATQVINRAAALATR